MSSKNIAAKKIIFLIRGKLGDSLIAYSVFKSFVERHPEDDITLIARKNYAELLEGESGFRLVPYRNRIQILLQLLKIRLFEKRVDAFAVLWGFGNILGTLARTSNARRRIYLDDRYKETFPEFPPAEYDVRQVDPAWRVARLIDPNLPKPDKLAIGSLAKKRLASGPRKAIGICPLSDEKRRNMDTTALKNLLEHLSGKFPGSPIYAFINPGEESIVPRDAPPLTEIKTFSTLPELVDYYTELKEWYGTDTGLYHLAAAMDIPCTVFFGPTQPHKNVMPMQDTVRVRLEALGTAHCDEKSCYHAACLNQAVLNFSHSSANADLSKTPASCPLRSVDSRQPFSNYELTP